MICITPQESQVMTFKDNSCRILDCSREEESSELVNGCTEELRALEKISCRGGTLQKKSSSPDLQRVKTPVHQAHTYWSEYYFSPRRQTNSRCSRPGLWCGGGPPTPQPLTLQPPTHPSHPHNNSSRYYVLTAENNVSLGRYTKTLMKRGGGDGGMVGKEVLHKSLWKNFWESLWQCLWEPVFKKIDERD